MASPEYQLLNAKPDAKDDRGSSSYKQWFRFLRTDLYLIVIHTILLTLSVALLLSIRRNIPDQVKDDLCNQTLSLEGEHASQLNFPGLPGYHPGRYIVQRFSNDPHSLYRGPPSNETDKAWDRIVKVGPFNITMNASGSNQTPDNPQPQMANLAVFHQLHCLKTLWQYTYFDYYKSRNEIFTKSETEIHKHLDHCVDYLRQALMCQTDMSIIPLHSVEGHDLSVPSYDVPRTCRDFEGARAWVLEHEVDLEED
ncbi:hypothetical protein BO71DRAFT_360226 [Aspergillus ellipticus CBS 707.79]|uniref:Tat pathway signal sequence n=1 Tax=Aspergillus ellipticus CBS 707.79 TaxID=1448320 RepID=A0A319D0H2_9EURO|nr:hypothetical protein BO71DRAFT_360226 [Aspergillus ellipticus CBS 707.79]